MKLFYLAFLCLFLFPLVSADTIPQNSTYDIKHAVRIEGGLPTSSTTCNITVLFSNKTVLVDFKQMTFGTKYYNYTLNQSQTAIKGIYTYDITCISGDLNNTESFTYNVNAGGIEPSESRTRAIANSIYLMFGLGILLFIGFILTNGNYTYKYTFFLMALLFFLIGINLTLVSLQDEIVNPVMERFFSKMTASSFYLYFAIFSILAILWIFTVVNTVILKMTESKLKRLGDRDAYQS